MLERFERKISLIQRKCLYSDCPAMDVAVNQTTLRFWGIYLGHSFMNTFNSFKKFMKWTALCRVLSAYSREEPLIQSGMPFEAQYKNKCGKVWSLPERTRISFDNRMKTIPQARIYHCPLRYLKSSYFNYSPWPLLSSTLELIGWEFAILCSVVCWVSG